MALPEMIAAGSAVLLRPSGLNLIVGRNGSGKSRFLRDLSRIKADGNANVSYVSPERAGRFVTDGGIENAIRGDKNWLDNNRLANQSPNFKPASATRLKELAMRFAVRVETDPTLRADLSKTFVTEKLSKINRMLSNVVVEREGPQDFYFASIEGDRIEPDQLSSGESEVLALATEILHFFETSEMDRLNLLLLDEPDVHLHPDLQARLARLLISELSALPQPCLDKTVICIATHSTPLICELATYAGCSIGIKEFGSTTVTQRPATEHLRKLAPFFGHPLSKSISEDVPLIIEGEDDERVWQQAARTAQGRLKIFPSLATTVDLQTAMETYCDSLMRGIYDEPMAISVRDGDGKRGTLEPIGCVRRFRLQCYAVENLLVTNDVLESIGSSWNDFVEKAGKWCEANATHKDVDLVKKLVASDDRLRDTNIKDIRNLIPTIVGSKRPWEVCVGQSLGRVTGEFDRSDNSLISFVGLDFLQAVGIIH